MKYLLLVVFVLGCEGIEESSKRVDWKFESARKRCLERNAQGMIEDAHTGYSCVWKFSDVVFK